MKSVYSLLWRCPYCSRVNGWTARLGRPKQRIDTNCSTCRRRIRFTPRRADKYRTSYGSKGRGMKPTVTDYRIYNQWLTNGEISKLAQDWNRMEMENRFERNQLENTPLSDVSNFTRRSGRLAPPEFSTWDPIKKRWNLTFEK